MASNAGSGWKAYRRLIRHTGTFCWATHCHGLVGSIEVRATLIEARRQKWNSRPIIEFPANY
jgi:hypothetical protein